MGRGRSYLAELVRINDTLIWSHDRTDSLVAAVELLREITGARIAPTYLLSSAGDRLVLVADAETQQAVGASYATMPAHEHVREPWVNVEEWPVSAADHQDSDGWLSLPEDFREWFGTSGVVVSIHADGRHLGATLLCFDGPWRLTRQRKEFLAAAGRILGNTTFHKEARFLRPVESGPFYAIKMEPGIMITMGGIKINEDMQVVDADNAPIEGLYSVGCDAGGLFGDSYILTVPGSANGFALTSGWLAADHATAAIRATAGV